MSERNNAPRSGGRTTGTRRDADAGGSDARGARQFSAGTQGGPAGPRRSGVRRDESTSRREGLGTPAARAGSRDREPVRTRGDEATRATVRETPSRSRGTGTPGGRGRRPVTDAPVAGTAALQVEAEALRITDPQPAPRLRVAPPAPISVPRAPFVAAMIGVVIVGVLGILLINTKTNENSFRIADLQNQAGKLDNQQQDLDNQLVEISSIGNLDAAARRLGLVKADNPALIRLPDGKLIGVLTPATGQPAVTAQEAKTDGTGDKGAANIVPQNGSPAEGLTPNGTTTAGTGANGAVTDGTTRDGTTTDGTTTGTAADGAVAPAGAGQ